MSYAVTVLLIVAALLLVCLLRLSPFLREMLWVKFCDWLLSLFRGSR